MSDIKVEVGQFRLLKKPGPMRAFFTLIIQPHGFRYIDCRYFVTEDGRRWFTFPQKEIKAPDGQSKSTYIPFVSVMDKEFLTALQESVLVELKTAEEKAVTDGYNPPNATTKQHVQVDTPSTF